MTLPGDPPPASSRWEVRPRTSAPADGAPSAAESLHTELARIERRIDDVITQGRGAFTEGSGSYDRATVAVLRLAALFENGDRYTEQLSTLTLDERREIVTTRNIAMRGGYGAMNTEIFWRTVTERIPEVITRIRSAQPSA